MNFNRAHKEIQTKKKYIIGAESLLLVIVTTFGLLILFNSDKKFGCNQFI